MNLFFEQVSSDANLTEIMVLSMAVSWTFTFIFMVCEPGEHVTQDFNAFDKEVEQCYFYMLQNPMKRLYLIFLLDTQQSINIQCYGRILCTRNTLKQVIVSVE